MKLYRVKVNGKVYEVELEAVSETSGEIKTEKPQVSTNGAQGVTVSAPIGGKVVDLCVSVGSQVKKGQKLVVIEAMKLENDVVSPADGIIKEVVVKKGDIVNLKDTLIIIG